MNFILWACRVVHVLSSVVWIGGLVYMNVVLLPVAEFERLDRTPLMIAVQKRFFPFVWSTLWPLLLTGFLLMISSPRFHWGDVRSTWAQLLLVKQLAFLAMGFFSWQSVRVVARLQSSSSTATEEFEGWYRNLRILTRRTIACGILALLCASALALV